MCVRILIADHCDSTRAREELPTETYTLINKGMFDTMLSTLEQELQRLRDTWNGEKPSWTTIKSLMTIHYPFECGRGSFSRPLDIRTHLERIHNVTISHHHATELLPVPCYKCDKKYGCWIAL